LLASSIVVAFLAAANAPSPLYERYETAWHASPLIGTIAFAAYAVAVIVGLLWLKELPALLGRRAVLLGAIAGQILALVLFAVAGSFALIVVGRVLQGLASGAALGTLSAAMVESDAARHGRQRRLTGCGQRVGSPAQRAGRAVSARPAADHLSHPCFDPDNPGALRATCHAARTAPPTVMEGGEPTGGRARRREDDLE
jgi:MFS family permease